MSLKELAVLGLVTLASLTALNAQQPTPGLAGAPTQREQERATAALPEQGSHRAARLEGSHRGARPG